MTDGANGREADLTIAILRMEIEQLKNTIEMLQWQRLEFATQLIEEGEWCKT